MDNKQTYANNEKSELPTENWMEDKLNEFYNNAINHSIAIVEQNYISGHSVVTPVLDNIINQLKKLKK